MQSPPPPRMVTVYNYWVEPGEDLHGDVSLDKAPLDVIVNEIQRKPLLGTAQQVEASALAGGKYYRRHPTGWANGAAQAPCEAPH